MAIIVVDTFIAAGREICFDLALDVDVHAESAAFSGERIVEPGRTAGRLEPSDLLTFEGRHLGVRQRFTIRIVAIERPEQFTDEMVRGLFRWLRHRHQFFSERGGTLMRDTVEWTTPCGILGRFADRLFLERHMRWFVATKQAHLKRIAERRAASE